MPDPDLQIRGGGGGGSPKILFLSLGPQFGLKIKRGEGGGTCYPVPSPGSATII